MWLALAIVMPGSALAVRIDYEVGGAVLHSDNIELAESGGNPETVVSPQLRFDVEQTGSTVELLAKGELQYLHFVDGEYSDQVHGELAGKMNWTLLPERLTFVVQDVLSRQPVNVLGGFSLGNQQQTNVFTAGPSLHARLGSATRGQLDLRFIDAYAEDTPDFDSQRYNVAGRLRHDFDAAKSLSLNAEATRVDYRRVAQDYTRYDGYAGYTSSLADVDISLDAGYSRLARRDVPAASSPLVRGALDWRMTPTSTLTTSVAYQISDATQDISSRTNRLDSPVIGDLTSSDVLVGPSVYRQRRVDVGYRYSGERFSLGINPYYERIRYLSDEEAVGRQLYHGAVVSAGYKLRPATDLQLVGARTRREFQDLGRLDHDTVYQASLNNRINRHWSWRVDVQHRGRDSTASNQSYEENAVVFSVAYRR